MPLLAIWALAQTPPKPTPPQPQPKAKPAPKPKEAKPKPLERPQVTIATTKGTIQLELEPTEAPVTVANFIALAQRGFYDGLTFHRVEDWVVQGGDPQGNGSGGPGYQINNETNHGLKHLIGAVGMANSGKDTAGSQFYILKKDTPGLDNGSYTLFGRVVAGQDVVNRIAAGDRMTKVSLTLPPGFKPRPFGATRRAEPENLYDPELPDDAASRSYRKTVRVKAQVTIQGAANITLSRGSGDEDIDEAILAALRLWKWQPALVNGQPVAQTQEFEYDLTTHSRRYDGGNP